MFAAAALAAGGMAFVDYDSSLLRAQDAPAARPGADREGQQQKGLPQGVKQAEQADHQGITKTLAGATGAALSAGKFEQLSQHLAPADQQRLKEIDQEQQKKLDQAINQFRQAWQQKYNKDLNLQEQAQAIFGDKFEGFTIAQGEVTNPAMMTNWPVEATDEGAQQQRDQEQLIDQPKDQGGMDQPRAGADQNRQNDQQVIELPDADDARAQAGQDQGEQPKALAEMGQRGADIKAGNAVAVATFPAKNNLPELRVSLVKAQQGQGAGEGAREGAGARAGEGAGAAAGGDWRIDIPDNLTANQIQQNLTNQIQQITQMKGQWPDDATEAQRIVSHRVMMALYDAGGQGQAQPGQQPGAQPGARPGAGEGGMEGGR